MEINDTNLKLLILDIIEELKRLRGLWKDEFRDVPPVLWFGDIHNNPQVLVISANPSRPDKPNSNPRIPYCKKWNIDQPDVEELMKDYNNYFVNNPSKKWFGGDMSHTQGRIEDFLNGLGASFFGRDNYIQALHIDLLPFSTECTFTAIDSQIPRKQVIVQKPLCMIPLGLSNHTF